MRKKIIGILVCGLFLFTSTTPLVIGTNEEINSNIEDELDTHFTINDVRYYKIDSKYISNQKIESSNNNGNLLQNPSFENGTFGVPEGWSHSQVYNEIYYWDNMQSFSGEKSIGVGHLTQQTQFCHWNSVLVPVDLKNNRYYLSVYYKYNQKPTNLTQSCEVVFRCYDENENPLQYGLSCMCNYSSEWTKYELEIYGDWMFPEQARIDTKYMQIKLGQEKYSSELADPEVEVRFDDVYFGLEENHPPLTPIIEGPISEKIQKKIYYNITIRDPDYDWETVFIDWGDGTNSSYHKWVASNTPKTIMVNHSWKKSGDYTIKAKCTDSAGAESGWATLEVIMPVSYNKPILLLCERLFQQFPNAFPLLRHMMGY